MPRTGADPYVPGHGDRRWSARRYDLALDYKVLTNHLSGTAAVSVELLQETETLRFDLYSLKASKVLVGGRKAKFAQTTTHLTVTLPPGQGPAFVVDITYAGKPRPMPGPDGRAGWEELTDGVLVGSQPHGAPSWFPCNDRPDDKAPYRVSLTTEAGYHVVGNGTLTETAQRSGRKRWTYEQPEPMASYLACVQIGRYAVTRVPASVPVEIVSPPGALIGAGSAFEHQGAMVDAMSEWFGPYPFANYRAVVAADHFEIPLEAQGLASFGRNHTAPSWENERLVAHELAHSWFGNSLTVRTWEDIWLHEGFACYAEWMWSEHRGLETVGEHASRHWQRLSRLPQDLVIGQPGAEHMFDDRIYKRGALTVHALRRLLGEERFFEALRRWTEWRSHGRISTPEFTARFAAEAGASGPAVRSLVQAWVYSAALPEI